MDSDTPCLTHLRTASLDDPLRVMISACMTGINCAFSPSANTRFESVDKILNSPLAQISAFCPEHFYFGTPRELCDIHGGTGFDVLAGRARVLTESGKDWTAGMITASEKMLEIAIDNRVELAILLDISAACGSQVIYGGARRKNGTPYVAGAGVCAAQLIKHRIPVISQRDYASLQLVYRSVHPGFQADVKAIDHHQTDWYRSYFSK